MFLFYLEDPPCYHGQTRLSGGEQSFGRVEVCFYGVWGTVCDDRWDSISAGVVCQQLGYSPHGKLLGAIDSVLIEQYILAPVLIQNEYV